MTNYTPDSLRALAEARKNECGRMVYEEMLGAADAWEAQEGALRYIVAYFDNDGLKVGCVGAERVWPAHLMERIAKGHAALAGEKP